MISKKVAVCSRTFSRHEGLRCEMEKRFSNVAFNDQGKALKGGELVDFLKDCAGAIVALEKIDEATLAELPNLKVVSKYGVGLDNIDMEVMQKYNVSLKWTGGLNRRSVSELTLGLILDLSRKITCHSNDIKNGHWKNLNGKQLSEKVVGIIGVGNIGRDLVELLKPFGCKVLVNDIVDINDYCRANGLENVSKDEIYQKSDVITLHIPYTKKTDNLISGPEFKVFKDDVIFVNTSRGKIVNEGDLFSYLKRSKSAAAAMDVFAVEPANDSPLMGLENFLATPHIGGSSKEGVLAMGLGAVSGLEQYFR